MRGNCPSSSNSVKGSVLNSHWLNGILGCSKVLGCFSSFLVQYIDGWDSVPDRMSPISKIRCINILENLTKKAPNLFQIGCFVYFFVVGVTKSKFSRYRWSK